MYCCGFWCPGMCKVYYLYIILLRSTKLNWYFNKPKAKLDIIWLKLDVHLFFTWKYIIWFMWFDVTRHLQNKMAIMVFNMQLHHHMLKYQLSLFHVQNAISTQWYNLWMVLYRNSIFFNLCPLGYIIYWTM